jgi:glycosyltransferase involved in cell wall biosynthesis
MNTSRQGLALVFTLGVTLKDWLDNGFLNRELAYYRRIAEQVGPLTFITYGGEADREIAAGLEGITVLSNEAGLPPEAFLKQAPTLFKERLGNVAVIKSNQIKGAELAVSLARAVGAKAMVRCGYLLSRFYANRGISARMRFGLWRAEWRLFHRADHLLLPTDEDAAYTRRWYALRSRKITVLPNFIDDSLFRPLPEIEREPGLIGFVGRLAAQKNLPALIEAMHGMEGARLLLIGDGPDREEIEGQAAQLNVALEITGRLPQKDIPAQLACCELFALPSHYEGMPKALIEAMATGIPVLATPVQGNEALIRHGESGWLTAGTDPASLRDGLLALRSDPTRARRIGEAGRAAVLSRFRLEVVLEKELSIYREMGLV